MAFMDLRIEKTYRALLAAFTELLESHRYEEVTVAMLCDKAMIRRTTFYKHFADKSDFLTFFIDNLRINLLRQGEERAEEALRDGIAPAERAEKESRAIFKALTDFMLEHEALVDNIFKSSMTGMLMLVMEDKVAEAIHERYSWVPEGRGGVSRHAAAEFAAGGIVRLLGIWWKEGHSKQAEEEIAIMCNQLVSRAVGLAV